jgi:hypothetical protein
MHPSWSIARVTDRLAAGATVRLPLTTREAVRERDAGRSSNFLERWASHFHSFAVRDAAAHQVVSDLDGARDIRVQRYRLALGMRTVTARIASARWRPVFQDAMEIRLGCAAARRDVGLP